MYHFFLFALLVVFCKTTTAQTTGYIDKRPQAKLRINAHDEGIVLGFGYGQDSCDILGVREAIVNKDTYFKSD